jgi:hypothetical protein
LFEYRNQSSPSVVRNLKFIVPDGQYTIFELVAICRYTDMATGTGSKSARAAPCAAVPGLPAAPGSSAWLGGAPRTRTCWRRGRYSPRDARVSVYKVRTRLLLRPKLGPAARCARAPEEEHASQAGRDDRQRGVARPARDVLRRQRGRGVQRDAPRAARRVCSKGQRPAREAARQQLLRAVALAGARGIGAVPQECVGAAIRPMQDDQRRGDGARMVSDSTVVQWKPLAHIARGPTAPEAVAAVPLAPDGSCTP